MRRRLLVLALAVSAACAGGGGGGEAVDASFERLDGRPATLSDYRGRPLVVNFFAEWCPPCVREMPAFEEVHQALGDEVAFLGVSVNETVEDATALVERTGVTYDTGRDPRGELVRELGGVGMPTTVLIDAGGRIAEAHTGELSGPELRALIDEHFGDLSLTEG